MKLRMTIAIIILVVVFGGVFGFDAARSYFIGQYFAHAPVSTVTISTANAKSASWSPKLSTVGSVVAVNGTTLSAQQAGVVSAIHFKSGQMVKKGQLLISLNDTIAQSTLASDTAKLHTDTINYKRNLKLIKHGAIAKSTLDTSRLTVQQDAAKVVADHRTLEEMNITAPFSGVIGIRQVSLGQFVNMGAPLVSLQSFDPIYINFSLPEQDLATLKPGQGVRISLTSEPQHYFSGKISAINSTVDPDTRNIQVQATLSNKQHKLYPGMFANVQVLLPIHKNVVVVPSTAVTYSLYGDTVYVVEKAPASKSKVVEKASKKKATGPKLIAKQVLVKVGSDIDQGNVIITSGIKAGDIVVTSGQLKLHNGAPVSVNNSVKLQ